MMNLLSKYTSKPYVIGILAIILIPSIGADFANSSTADFFLSALYVISLVIICGALFILPDIRKWMKLKNNPEYLYNEIMKRIDKYNAAVRDNDEYAKLDEKGRRKLI